MKHPLPPLDTLKAFEAAARHLSFSQAADDLCVSTSAVSYQIRKLEESLRCALFKRTIRQVYLTDAGQKLFRSTQSLFDGLGNAIARLNDDEQTQPVYVAATTYVSVRWLSPRIARFNELHPNVSIVLQHTVNSAEFKLHDVDIAIRWCRCDGKSKRDRLRELPLPLSPACSPRLLERLDLAGQLPLPRGALAKSSLGEVPLLYEDSSLDLWDEWMAPSGLKLANPRRMISDANVKVQAAIDGQGLIMADDLMDNELGTGSLVAPFEEKLDGYGYAVMFSPSRLANKNVLAIREWLVSDV